MGKLVQILPSEIRSRNVFPLWNIFVFVEISHKDNIIYYSGLHNRILSTQMAVLTVL